MPDPENPVKALEPARYVFPYLLLVISTSGLASHFAFPVFLCMMRGRVYQKLNTRPRKTGKSRWNRPAMLCHCKVISISCLVAIL
jgi:hypothetical protein